MIPCVQIPNSTELYHYGVKGMKWGVRRTPEQLGHKKKVAKILNSVNIVKEAIRSGKVLKTVNPDKQRRHTQADHLPGRSYIYGDVEYAQKLIDKLSGTGEALMKNGKWIHKERVSSPDIIGTYIDGNGVEVKSNVGIIVYSKTGTHIYPGKRKER